MTSSFLAPATAPTKRGKSRLSALEPVNLMPVLAVVLLFSLLGALLWIIHINEQDVTRLDLVRDTLWVERELQFQITSDRETLQRLADDVNHEAEPTHFAAQTRQLLTSNPAIVAIGWFNGDGTAKAVTWQRGLSPDDGTEGDLPAVALVLQDRHGGEASVSKPFKFGSKFVFGQIASATGGVASGSAIAIVSYDRMLAQNIPWWIAEKRAVELRDLGGTVLASRSRNSADPQAQSDTIAFGPQSSGLFITLFTFRVPSNLTRDGLIGAILVLGILAVGGLLARENHLRKRRTAEIELKREHAFRKAMEDALTVGMRARDLEGKIIYVNQAFCKMMGWSSAELVGSSPLVPDWLPEELEKSKAFHEQVLAGTPPADGVELAFKRRDGTLSTVLVYEAPLIGLDGKQTGWMGSFLDVTERKSAEELARRQADQIENTARLVLIGEMASILAHDLNQPLATIASYQTGLLNHLARGSISKADIATTLAKMGDATQRAGSIIRHVQDFVKRKEPSFERADIGALVARIVGIFQREPHAQLTRIVLAVDAATCIGLCDIVLIEQVVINLLRNAEEAMAELPKRKRRIDVSVASKDDGIEVAIADQGPGIPADMVGDIFRPFVSTKPNGMGLGLTICRSVLEAHHSRLTCSTRPEGGSIFKFWLSAEA